MCVRVRVHVSSAVERVKKKKKNTIHRYVSIEVPIFPIIIKNEETFILYTRGTASEIEYIIIICIPVYIYL